MSSTTCCCGWIPVLPLGLVLWKKCEAWCDWKRIILKTGEQRPDLAPVRPSGHIHLSISPIPTMEKGKYPVFLSLAVILDIIGIILLFLGIFANLSYWDFFVLSGPLLIFLSLVFWIFWYMGSLTVSEEELNLPKQDILWLQSEGSRTESRMTKALNSNHDDRRELAGWTWASDSLIMTLSTCASVNPLLKDMW